MAEKSNTKTSGSYTNDCLTALNKAFDVLEHRCKLESVFSPDLAGTVTPILNSLRATKSTYMSTLTNQSKSLTSEAIDSSDNFLRSIGAQEMLNAAVSLGNEFDVSKVREITMTGGARRVSWLEIIKEIIALIINVLPIPIPDFLKKVINEILKILDKIFGGMPHEEHPSTAIS